MHWHDKKAHKTNEKSLFRKLIKLITSDEDINFSESFNLAANKKHESCPKKSKSKRKMTKTC